MLEKRLTHRHHNHHRGAIIDNILGDSKDSSSSKSGSSSTGSSSTGSGSSSTKSGSSSTGSSSKTDSSSSKTSSSSSSSETSSSSSDSPSPSSSPTDSSQAQSTTTDPAGSNNGSNDAPTLGTGPIVGIAAGGVAAIIILAIIIGCCVRRKSKRSKKPVVDPFNRHSFKHEAELIPDPIEADYRNPSPRPNMAGMGAATNNYIPPPSLPGLAHVPRVDTPPMMQSRSPFDPYGQHHQLQHPQLMNVGMVPPYKPNSPSYFPAYSDTLIPPHPPNLDRSPSVQSHSADISSPPMYTPPDNPDFLPNPYENKGAPSGKGNDTTTATYRPTSLRPGMQLPQGGNSRGAALSHNLNDAYSGI
ncbi:hypothetical protein E3Q08_00332 [Wallemia mellicola]|nr:hypothetical protein E3Q08_00332 [Wallemia mellicola]